MNMHKQNKHIEGKSEYEKGKSKITASLDYLQKYYLDNLDKVEMINKSKGRFNFDKVVGIYIDLKTNENVETNKVIVHYSKTGYHFVPARPK